MDKDFQIELLSDLLNENWEGSTHRSLNRITDIRTLIDLLGSGFSGLDDSALEIETIVSTAMGLGFERLPDMDMEALSPFLELMKNQLDNIRYNPCSDKR